MRAVVRKWGNSASVRIPASMLDTAKLHLDQPVDVRAEKGRIIITPIEPDTADIDALVASITDENIHEYFDMGPPAGNEMW